MLRLSAVLSSDTVNRYGSRFRASEMARALCAHWRTGLPSTISHDAHRLGGWTLPTAVSITRTATRLHGLSLVPETQDEQTQLQASYERHLAARVDGETAPYQATLRDLLDSHLAGDERFHAAAASALVGPGLARRVAASIFASEDKDGLVDLRGLDPIQPGVYRHGDLVLFAHPFFRRSLSRWNNLNGAVLGALEGLREERDATIRVRLDPDMVGLAASVQRALEFDYWYGPKFDDELPGIPTGVTRHEASERERYFFGISRIEFWWQSRDAQHILEAEEVRDLPTLGAGSSAFGCRYVHSIVDEKDGRIFHLDGAIRSYDEAALIQRLDQSIADAGRKTEYTKLWRTDGAIPLSRWKQLVHDHFRDNPLVAEYFSSSANEDASVDDSAQADAGTPTGALGTARARLVPHAIDAGDGPGFLLSLHESDLVLEHERELQPLETITADGVVRHVFDADSVELRKALRRRGQDIHIPDDALRMGFEDRYVSVPLLRHRSALGVGATIDALRELLEGWARTGNDDRAMAISLSAPIAGVEVRCAVYAHMRDLASALGALRDLFALGSPEDVIAWTEARAGVLRDDAGPIDASARFDSLMTPHETYRVSRVQISSEELQLKIDGTEAKHELRLPVEDGELIAAVRARELMPAFAWVIEESTCSRCSASYFSCACSKVLDDDVTQRITRAQIAYAFWTDRRS